MTRRLLFDQNLSPRLIELLSSRFPDSAHVLKMGMSTASDAQVLEFAAEKDFVVVTKDKDFADLVTRPRQARWSTRKSRIAPGASSSSRSLGPTRSQLIGKTLRRLDALRPI